MTNHHDRCAESQTLSRINNTPAPVADNGRVRLGLTSPSFPPARATPSKVADSSKVRLGLTSPMFPPARGK